MALASELVTKVVADTKDFNNKMSAASRSATDFSSGVKSAAKIATAAFVTVTASAAGVYVAINKIAEGIDTLSKNAGILNVPVAGMQRLGYIADLAGVSSEELNTQLLKMTKTLGDIPTQELNHSLKLMGLSLSDLKGLRADEQYLKIADAIGKIKDKNEQASAAAAIFGRNYAGILKVIRQGATETSKEFEKLGIALTDSQAQAVEAFLDSQTRLSTIFKGFGQKVVVHVSDAFKKLIDWISETILKMGGIDKVAQSFARAIVDAVTWAIEKLQGLLNVFDKIVLAMAKIDRFVLERDRNRMASDDSLWDSSKPGSVQIAQATGISLIPSIPRALNEDRINRNSKEITSIQQGIDARNRTTNEVVQIMKKSSDDIGKANDTLTKNTIKGATAVKDFADAVQQSTGVIGGMLKGQLSSGVSSELDRILGKQLSDKFKVGQSADFDDLVASIFEITEKTRPGEAPGNLQRLFSRLTGYNDNPIQRGITEELKKFAEERGVQLGSNTPKAEIKVTVDENLGLKLMANPGFRGFLKDESTKNLTLVFEGEAISVGK